MKSRRDLPRLLLEVAHVLTVIRCVESDRVHLSPQLAVEAARRRAPHRPRREPGARERLQRAIAFVDSWFRLGPNCLRRSLLEMSLDRGAARERLLAGFMSGGAERSGHAWLESHPVEKRYDAVIRI